MAKNEFFRVNEVLLFFWQQLGLLSDRKTSPKILFKSTKHGSWICGIGLVKWYFLSKIQAN
jgi:hypothetical protein